MKDHKFPENCIDMVAMGERGQVVIPAQVRERFGLTAGDRLMVFTKGDNVICMVPASNIRHLVDVLNHQLDENDSPHSDNK